MGQSRGQFKRMHELATQAVFVIHAKHVVGIIVWLMVSAVIGAALDHMLNIGPLESRDKATWLMLSVLVAFVLLLLAAACAGWFTVQW